MALKRKSIKSVFLQMYIKCTSINIVYLNHYARHKIKQILHHHERY